MKKIICFILISSFICGSAFAKSKRPDNYISNSQKTAMRQINMYDADEDGRLSLEEFTAKSSAPETRNTRRQKRKAQKEGTYQVPEDQFKTIDKNGDGYINLKEFEDYISKQTKKSNGRIRYY